MLAVVVVVRRTLIAALVGLALTPAAASAQAAECTKTWSGTTSTVWNQPSNWTPAGIPGADDVVCIGPAATETVANVATTVRAIRSQRPLRTTAALTISDAAEPSSFTTLTTGSTFSIAGDVRASGATTFGGTATLSGAVEAAAVTFSGTVSVAGEVQADAVTSSGTVTLAGDLEAGTLTHTIGTMTGPGDVRVASMTWNGGTMSGTGTTTVTAQHTFLGNTSTLSVRDGRRLVTSGSGTWNANMGMTGDAIWTNSAAVTITGGGLGGTVAGGVRPELHNLPGGSIVRASGNYSISGVALDNDGLVEGTANTISISHAVGVSSGRFVGVSMAAEPLRVGPEASIDRISVGGMLILPDDATLEIANLTISGGDVVGRTTLVLRGHFWAYYGTVGSAGMTMILPADATMEWTAAFALHPKRLESYGDVTVTETGLGRPQGAWGSRTVWENFGRVTLVSGLFPTLTGDEAARIVNHGTITKTGTGTFQIRPVIVNDGVIDIQRGQITATRFEQSPNGTLRFDIGGTGNNEYGRLSAGAFLYSGRLEATRSPGYTPGAGTRFPVIAATQTIRSGLFHAVATPGFTLDEAATSNLGLVAAVPEAKPGTAAPGLAGLAPTPDPAPAAPNALSPPAALDAARPAHPPAALDAASPPADAPPSLSPATPAGAIGISAAGPVSSPAWRAVRDRRVRLGAGRTFSLRAPTAARVRLVGHSRGVRVRRAGGSLRVTRVAGGRQTVRYRFVAADGARSRVATLTLRS